MLKRTILLLSVFAIILFVTLLAFTDEVEAREFKLIELTEVTFHYKDFFPGGYSPLLNESGLGDRTLGKQVNLNLNMDLFKYFYWHNRVHGTTDEIIENGQNTGHGQFRMIGWNFQLGIRPSKYLSVEYEHHSQHLLDASRPARFPVEDSIGIKIHIFKLDEPRATIFP